MGGYNHRSVYRFYFLSGLHVQIMGGFVYIKRFYTRVDCHCSKLISYTEGRLPLKGRLFIRFYGISLVSKVVTVNRL